jgi:hypothetical protein
MPRVAIRSCARPWPLGLVHGCRSDLGLALHVGFDGQDGMRENIESVNAFLEGARLSSFIKLLTKLMKTKNHQQSASSDRKVAAAICARHSALGNA